MDDVIALSDSEFRKFASLVYDRFGIKLSDEKKTLVSGRLAKRVRALGLPSFSDYLALVLADSSGAELSELINRISTNHSFFFREKDHFDYLEREILPRISSKAQAKPGYPLRVWSAGCAAGEEVYTICMVLSNFFGPGLASMDLGVLATDVSLHALGDALKGEYAPNRIQDVPRRYLDAYFEKSGDETYRVREEIRRMVMFKKLNFMDENFPMRGQFDFIFCRNVMIYFDEETRRRLVKILYSYVKPGGYFFIGHSESIQRATCPFEYVKPAVYRKAEA
jgi:chemotaxis protein methyltransferase CheR